MAIRDLLRSAVGIGLDDAGGRMAARTAREFLQRTRLIVFGRVCRLVEVEFYLHSPAHPDPFAHRHPMQQQVGRWYFHRTGSGYRGGTFKGVDATFGDAGRYGGILIRGLRTEDGGVIDGPSLCVDYMLSRSGAASVRELDELLQGSEVWSPTYGLRLAPAGRASSAPVFSTARVGLSRSAVPADERARQFLLRRYRFLTLPREIRKGRPQLILALLSEGRSPAEIQQLTGSPRSAIERYRGWVEEGRKLPASGLVGRPLGTRELCLLEGFESARAGGSAARRRVRGVRRVDADEC